MLPECARKARAADVIRSHSCRRRLRTRRRVLCGAACQFFAFRAPHLSPSTEPRASATGLAGPPPRPPKSSRRAKTLTDSSTIDALLENYETNPISAPNPLAAITYRQKKIKWVRVASNLQFSKQNPRRRPRPLTASRPTAPPGLPDPRPTPPSHRLPPRWRCKRRYRTMSNFYRHRAIYRNRKCPSRSTPWDQPGKPLPSDSRPDACRMERSK